MSGAPPPSSPAGLWVCSVAAPPPSPAPLIACPACTAPLLPLYCRIHMCTAPVLPLYCRIHMCTAHVLPLYCRRYGDNMVDSGSNTDIVDRDEVSVPARSAPPAGQSVGPGLRPWVGQQGAFACLHTSCRAKPAICMRHPPVGAAARSAAAADAGCALPCRVLAVGPGWVELDRRMPFPGRTKL